MDTINLIITNLATLAHHHIDWSAGSGPIWLAAGLAVFFGSLAALVVTDSVIN